MYRGKRLVSLAVAILVIVGMVSCVPQVRDLPTAEAEAVRSQAEGVVENVFAGLESGDYAAFSQDFDGKMKEALNEAKFAETRSQLEGRIGRYQARTFAKAQETQGYITLIYDARFEHEEHVTVRVVLRREDRRWLVSGLWFDSPKLRAK
ncbi:MAG: DUF3887 domain-containing protein [Anaerolineae bacterium]